MFSERKRKGTSLYDVVTYTLPKLHTGKNWVSGFSWLVSFLLSV